MSEEKRPTQEHILQFFEFAHLPKHLQAVSQPFYAMAYMIFANVPRNPERTVALRKLLESKDAAVRAVVAQDPPEDSDDPPGPQNPPDTGQEEVA